MNENKLPHNDKSSQETQQWWPVASPHRAHGKPSAILKSFIFPQGLRFILCIYQKHQLLSEFRAVTTK